MRRRWFTLSSLAAAFSLSWPGLVRRPEPRERSSDEPAQPARTKGAAPAPRSGQRSGSATADAAQG